MSPLIANHLWQSTVFAMIAALLALSLRRADARARHWIWLAASVKFLIPFSLLISAGSRLQLAHPAFSPPRLSITVAQISQPFTPPMQPVLIPAGPAAAPLLPFLWLFGSACVLLFWFARWRRIRSIVRAATPIDLGVAVETRFTPALMEPGVFGIARPILLLPEGIVERLTSSQLRAIVAHELSHVRRRDNLTAALHMIVEAIFWFHPLVWWIGARLVAERERACDEEVLRAGSEPLAYAEGLLNVCKLCLESPLACVSGVTGSDLKRRIEVIMSARIAVKLTLAGKLLLAAAGFAAMISPVLIGVIRAQSSPLRFEVASVKPDNSSENPHFIGWQSQPGGTLVIRGQFLRVIIAGAWGLPMFNNENWLTGAPPWIDSARFDIDAKAGPDVIPAGMPESDRNQKVALMLRNLLADRFKLAIHRETRQEPVYDLVVAKGGLKLPKAKMAEKDCPEISTRDRNCHALSGGQGGGIRGNTVSFAEIVAFLQVWTDRPVVDKTGITGLYDIDIRQGWVPMHPRPGPPPGQEPTAEDLAFADPTRPTLNAVLATVGLKLEPSKGPVEVVVIDHVERPSEN